MDPETVLKFWLDECEPADWYKNDADLDARIRDQFEDAWNGAMAGQYSLWLTYPSGTLAYIILTDQFPRNMFRDTDKAFASDKLALAAAKSAIDKGWDKKIDEPARQFFYMPLMHSENLCDQERCVRMVLERMPETSPMTLPHARGHRDVIRQFGRFPYRNVALGRASTEVEKAYVAAGGYAETMRMLDAKKAG